MEIKASAPGSLFLSGEWAILEPENKGIVIAPDKKIFVEVKDSLDEAIHINLDSFGMNGIKAKLNGTSLKFEKKLSKKQKKNILFVKAAIETSLMYFGNLKPFQIRVYDYCANKENVNREKKFGFGFSAASTVATIGALFSFFKNVKKTRNIKKQVFNLSIISHYFAQGKVGSGFDVASSVFGGMFAYKRFNPLIFKKYKKEKNSLEKIVKSPLPGFFVEKMEIPKDFNLLVGWTKESSKTSEMIKKMNKWKEKNKESYSEIIGKIGKLTKSLILFFKKENKRKILELFEENEEYLRELGKKSGILIETKKLNKLCKIATKDRSVGKISGAGGGDCGIAISFHKEILKEIKKEWDENGIMPIDININYDGLEIISQS